MLILSSLLASSALVYLGLRLSVQSSYYADPTRRLCGTMDRFFGWADLATHKMTKRWNSVVPASWQLSVTDPVNNLQIYQDVSQWWWYPKKTPAGNLVAMDRFVQQRQEKLGI